MPLSASHRLPRLLVLGLGFPLAALNLWVFSSLYRAFEGIASIFILAGVIALILNFPVRFLQRSLGLRRGWAIGIIVGGFIGLMLLSAAFLVPLLLLRFLEFTRDLPQWIDSTGDKLEQLSATATRVGLAVDTSEIIEGMTTSMKSQMEGILLGIPGFVFGSLGNFLSVFFLIVLTVFFLIYGGELVRNVLLSWLPGESGLRVLGILRRNFNSFIFNQAVLSMVLTCALTLALVLLGAPFPVLSGVAIGLMGFIPFGAIVGVLAISLLFLLKSFWLGLRVFAVLIVVDQIIENILPPRLLGKLTGLNPIVILFSVMVGGTLAGFYGIITAVPIAATIKELFLTGDLKKLVPALDDTPDGTQTAQAGSFAPQE